MKSFIVAVDGPSGTGKGTVSKHVAKHYGFNYLDTGLFYRTLAYFVNDYDINVDDESRIVELTNDLNIEIQDGIVIANGIRLEKELRNDKIALTASRVSSIQNVRMIVNDKIRRLCEDKQVVVDGRDITTLVFPNADVKIYLDASCDTRARRRYNQSIEMGMEANFDQILANIKNRDEMDRNKEYGALTVAEDAIIVDNTNLTIEETIDKFIEIIGSELK